MTRTSRHSLSFWLIALANGVLLFGSAAPSPLYPVYQHLWGFSEGMLTVIFAVYVVGLVASLLTLGALSDHVGRKPVLVGALLVVIASMFVFAEADGTATLLIARLLQGLGTGAALGALSAALVDLQPSARIGSVVTGVAPILGLACGIVGSAVLVQFGPDPRELVYVLLAALLAVLALATLTIVPETSPRHGLTSRRHALQTMTPRISIPPEVRSAFIAGTPALIAVWALGGLVLSLGSSIISAELDIANVAVGGVILASFFFCATIAAPLAGSPTRPMSLPVSYLCLAVGLGLLLVGSLGNSIAVYTAGLVISGIGFSTAYIGVIASVAHVGPAARGAAVRHPLRDRLLGVQCAGRDRGIRGHRRGARQHRHRVHDLRAGDGRTRGARDPTAGTRRETTGGSEHRAHGRLSEGLDPPTQSMRAWVDERDAQASVAGDHPETKAGSGPGPSRVLFQSTNGVRTRVVDRALVGRETGGACGPRNEVTSWIQPEGQRLSRCRPARGTRPRLRRITSSWRSSGVSMRAERIALTFSASMMARRAARFRCEPSW